MVGLDKPVWKQVSFWIALVMTNIGLLLSNGVLVDGDVAKGAGWVLTILTALGYKHLTVPADAEPKV